MRIFHVLLFLLLCVSFASSQDFSAVKENMTPDKVVSLVGNPSKKLTSQDKSVECFVWYSQQGAWYVFFIDGKTVIPATDGEEVFHGLMRLYSSSTQQSASSDKTTSSSAQETESSTALPPAALASKIQIDITACKMIHTYSGSDEAGIRLKIKNNSDKTIYDLGIVVYYLDKNGKAFYEESFHPVSSSSWTNTLVLKPNYSLLYPADPDNYAVATGMDTAEWDEGKVKLEINEIGTEPPK